MPTKHRRERASGFIHEEVTILLRDAVRDPRVQTLTITDVDLTPDRRVARIYVACYGGEEALQEGLEGLESAKGFLKKRLGQLLHWNFIPEIEFRVDRSWEQGAKIDTLLKEVAETEAEQDKPEQAAPPAPQA
jgi:ribosome-binding factor A